MKAQRARTVLLTSDDVEPLPAVELVVEDGGNGFDPADARSGRLGLGIMAERAEAIGARLQVDSRPGEGTRIRVVWHAELFRGSQDSGAGTPQSEVRPEPHHSLS